MFYISSVLVLVIGLLADLIVAQRRHLPTELFRADELRENMPNLGARETIPGTPAANAVRQAS
jgi:hypothetical protein